MIDRERGAVPNFARVVIETSGLADRLVISKSDLAGATDLDALRDRLQKLNPRAGIDIAIAGALDP